jgi:hypothetical protein
MAEKNRAKGGDVPDLSMQNEGIRVPFRLFQANSLKSGVSTATGQVMFDKVPAPERRFVADCFELRDAKNGQVQWLFGQTKVDGKTLRALLDIRYPIASMGGVSEMLRRYVFEAGPSFDLSIFTRKFEQEPEQTLGLEANFLRLNAGKNSATFDYYHGSGAGMASGLTQGYVYFLPIVRVIMPFELVHSVNFEMQKSFSHLQPKASAE